MFDEADPSKRRSDALAEMVLEDLDRLSVGELDTRIAVLLAEVDRTRARRNAAVSLRSAADSLFKP